MYVRIDNRLVPVKPSRYTAPRRREPATREYVDILVEKLATAAAALATALARATLVVACGFINDFEAIHIIVQLQFRKYYPMK